MEKNGAIEPGKTPGLQEKPRCCKHEKNAVAPSPCGMDSADEDFAGRAAVKAAEAIQRASEK